MQEVTQAQLNDIIANHKLWIEGNGGAKASFVNKRLTDLDFHGDSSNENESGFIDLSGSSWKRCSIIHSDVNQVLFDNCDMTTVSFVSCNLINVSSQYSKFVGVNFDGGNLTGGGASNSNFLSCSFRNVKLQGFLFNAVTIENTNFSGSDMTNIEFKNGCNLYSWSLTNAKLNGISVDASTSYNT